MRRSPASGFRDGAFRGILLSVLGTKTFPKFRKQWWLGYAIWAPPLVLIVFVLLSLTGPARRLEAFLLDRLVEIRHRPGQQADPRLFFLGIDDATQQQIGRWPFARIFHGNLLVALSTVHPAAVAWDILFSEEDAINDDAFVEAVGLLGAPVISAASRADEGTGTPAAATTDFGLTQPLSRVKGDSRSVLEAASALIPIEALRKVSYFGFVDTNPDLDGVRRKMPLVVRIGPRFFPSFALQSLMEFWKLKQENIQVVLGSAVYIDGPNVHRRIPIDRSGQMMLNYHYEVDGFRRAGYGQILTALTSGAPAKNLPDLQGKLVVVALHSTGTSEIGPSPLSPLSSIPLAHMNALDNILREDYLHVASRRSVWLGWLLASFASLLVFERTNYWISAAGLAVISAIALGSMYVAFAKGNLWVPLGMPLLGFAALHFGGAGSMLLRERLAKQQIKGAFSSFVGPSILNEILKNPDGLALGGVRKPVTVLFSDIRGFTSLSEASTEEGLVAQLNEYFTEMVACVNRHGGTLHKFIGDAVMAVWGDLVSKGVEEDARNAVLAALEMRSELAKLNARWIAEGRHAFKIGVGLNHGNVLVGRIGAPQRMEFTVIGDAVNAASRIEGVTKEWHTDIAVGPYVRALAGDRFFFRTLGIFRLVGKREGLRVYAVVRELEPGESAPASSNLYERAFSDYVVGEFKSASEAFEQFLQTEPGDHCGAHYLKHCGELMENAPGEAWDGVHVSKTK